MTTRYNHGPSEQTVCTPPELIKSVELKLDVQFGYDVAATAENSITGPSRCCTEQDNALTRPWSGFGTAWCNPPYRLAGKFCEKAWHEFNDHGQSSVLLIPASVGSNYWADWVDFKARVLFLRPRVTFVGHKDPFIKDLAILFYGTDKPGYECWDWRG